MLHKSLKNPDENFENLSHEEKAKLHKEETDRMFDTAEACLMEYISKYLNIPMEDLYKDSTGVVKDNNKIYIGPLSGYENKYILLSLGIVPYDYVSKIPKELYTESKIEQAIGFLYHSVLNVYSAIINCNNIKDDKMEILSKASFHFEMDDDTLTLYPVYIYANRRAELMLLKAKEELNNALNKFKNSDDIDNNKQLFSKTKQQYERVVSQLNKISYDRNEAYKIETDMRNQLSTMDRIGIIYEEIEK